MAMRLEDEPLSSRGASSLLGQVKSGGAGQRRPWTSRCACSGKLGQGGGAW